MELQQQQTGKNNKTQHVFEQYVTASSFAQPCQKQIFEIQLNEDYIMALNLRILQQIDPKVTNIKLRCKYANLYELDDGSNTWHNCDFAGCLFVVDTSEGTKIILLNQKSRTDFIESIGGWNKVQFNQKQDMILYKTKDGVYRGIQISEQEELIHFYQLWKKL